MIIDTGVPGSIGGHVVELAPESGHYVTVYVEVEDLEVQWSLYWPTLSRRWSSLPWSADDRTMELSRSEASDR